MSYDGNILPKVCSGTVAPKGMEPRCVQPHCHAHEPLVSPWYAGHGLRGCCQVAARAQRASVERSEVARYEAYDALHGAKYVDPAAVGGGADGDDDDGWDTPPPV